MKLWIQRWIAVVIALAIGCPGVGYAAPGQKVNDEELVLSVNKVFLVLQKEVQEKKRLEPDTQVYLSEEQALRYIAEVLVTADRCGVSIDSIVKRLQFSGCLEKKDVSSKGYLRVEVQDGFILKAVAEVFPESRSVSVAGVEEVYQRLIGLYEYREALNEKLQEELQIKYGRVLPEIQREDLEFPLGISWWRDCVTSEFGDRDIDEINESIGGSSLSRNHTGLDIGCIEGTELYASGFGQVVDVTDLEYGLGKSITVFHGEYTTVYGHLSEVKVNVGDYVDKGELIGLTGTTGWSTGPHLHYEIYRDRELLNPLEVFAG